MRETRTGLSRRQALQVLALMGVTGPLATKILAQVASPITPEVLRTARALIDQGLEEDRLDVVAPALQRNLDQFQIVRDLEIDDLVEPGPIFRVTWR